MTEVLLGPGPGLPEPGPVRCQITGCPVTCCTARIASRTFAQTPGICSRTHHALPQTTVQVPPSRRTATASTSCAVSVALSQLPPSRVSKFAQAQPLAALTMCGRHRRVEVVS